MLQRMLHTQTHNVALMDLLGHLGERYEVVRGMCWVAMLGAGSVKWGQPYFIVYT